MKALRTLLPYYRPYLRRLALGLMLVVLAAAFTSAVPWLLRSAIDSMRAGAPVRRVWILAAEMVGIALLGGAARFGMRQVLNTFSRHLEYDLRNDLFARLETMDAPYYARMRTGDLMARLTNDLSAVRLAAGPALMYLTNTIAGGIFALAFMLHVDVRLTAIALLPMVFLPYVMARMGRAIHTRFEAVQAHFGVLTTLAQENLAGVRIVRAYRQEAPEVRRFGELNEQYLEKNMHLVRLYGAMNPLLLLLAGLGTVVVLGFGGLLVVRGTITVGAFVAFGFYLAILTWPMIALGWVTNLFQRGAASMGRLNEILTARPAVASPEHPRHLPATAGGRAVELRNVSFHYPTPDGAEPRWVLRDVSFFIPAGGTLGVVGATGSGKSALMDLLPRFFDPQEGEILVDGIPIRELPLDELRSEIGYVPQESLLFSDTIGANLRYGSEDADAAQWAARVAQLEETIAAFPGGFETMLGERGINLSGGQKQRAALARALARHPSIVMLDDALSAVDTHTEAAILRSLHEALHARTALIASHRVSAIRDATWIIVLDEGRIVEQGRHTDLLALGGRYWSLLSRQQLVEAIEEEGTEPAETPASAAGGAD